MRTTTFAGVFACAFAVLVAFAPTSASAQAIYPAFPSLYTVQPAPAAPLTGQFDRSSSVDYGFFYGEEVDAGFGVPARAGGSMASGRGWEQAAGAGGSRGAARGKYYHGGCFYGYPGFFYYR